MDKIDDSAGFILYKQKAFQNLPYLTSCISKGFHFDIFMMKGKAIMIPAEQTNQ